MKNLSTQKIGFLQALGVLVYCVLVSSFMRYSGQLFDKGPGFWGPILMLMLLVFSAGLTGSLVFGYPVYLAMHKKIKEALEVLAYTLVFLLFLVLVVWSGIVLSS